jgi:predicted kinase
MIDRIFGALLTFCVLAGGTVALGSAMFDHDRRAEAARVAAPQVVQLPRVEITVKRPTIAQAEPDVPVARQLQ